MSTYLGPICTQTTAFVQNSWTRVRDASTATAAWALNFWTTKLQPTWANKYIDSYIRTLDSIDALILTASGLLAIGVMLVVIPLLGKPFIAFGILGSAIIFMCGGALVRHRSKMKISAEAVTHVDRIIELVRSNPFEFIQLNQIELIMVTLRTVEIFEQDKKKIKELDKRYKEFREHYNNQDPGTFNNQKAMFVTYLEGFRKQLVPYIQPLIIPPEDQNQTVQIGQQDGIEDV